MSSSGVLGVSCNTTDEIVNYFYGKVSIIVFLAAEAV